MKKVLVVVLMLLIPVMVFAVDYSYSGLFRTRTTDLTYALGENIGSEDPDVMNMTDYRLRLFNTVTMSDSLKAVWGVEVNGVWGDDEQNRDEVNVQTKHLYLDFTPDMADWLNVRVGLQGYRDPFGGAIFDEDATGIFFMPQFDSINLMMGWYQFESQDITGHSDNMYVIQACRESEDFRLGAAILYDKGWMNPGLWGHAMYELVIVIPIEYDVMWMGLYGTYITDAMEFGGHFVYNSGKFVKSPFPLDEDFSGMFAYLYGKYAMNDKLSMKIHFGYSSGQDLDSDDQTGFYAVAPYADQYGLEYLYPGAVYDGQSVFNSYGDYPGQMVIAANICYDFMYLNFGMINTTWDNWITDSKALGTEIDLGFKYPLTDDLDLCGVYAMFMPGDVFEDMFGYNETAHELSFKMQYNF